MKSSPVSNRIASIRADSSDEQAIKDLESRFAVAFNARDVDAIMKVYVPDQTLFVFKDQSIQLVVRVTDLYGKVNGNWLIAHEHVSVPVDLETGKPDMVSQP
jgi:ketosteroid isomerase-like protein